MRDPSESDPNETDRDTENESRDGTKDESQSDGDSATSAESSDKSSDKSSGEADVPGVTVDPDDDKKSLEVDTNERLDQKNKHLDDVPEDELLKERDERLDPDNRPDNVEVDNSQRTFNPETGLFEDSDVEPPEGAPFATTEAEESKTSKEPEDGDDAQDDTQDTEESKQAAS